VIIGRSGESQLTNAEGEVTSHLQGMFTRTCRMLEVGIKPVYVFDGKPPTMKAGTFTCPLLSST
jgi:flap endonuclease-1